jgi:tRNA 2-thiouridine synthesizing protein B
MPNESSLHLVSSSPFTGSALADCLRVITAADSVLLIENGVWAIHGEQSWQRQLQGLSERHAIYVLAEDAALRGIHVLPPFQLIDYETMVALACEHARSVSWFNT